MLQLSISQPKIEQFFNNSKEEVLKALEYIVDNDIKEFRKSSDTTELSKEQKEELDSRISSFHDDRSIGRSWSEIKSTISK